MANHVKTPEILRNVFHRSRLQKKFLRFFFVVGILPLVLMGLVSIYVVNLTHRIDVATLEQTLLQQKVAEIDKFLREAIGILQIQVGYAELLPIALRDQEFLLEGILKTNEAFREVSFICAFSNSPLCQYGRETAKRSRSSEPAASGDLIFQKEHPKFVTAIDDRDYFGPVYYSRSGPMMSLASPIKNKNGQIVAVLAGELNLEVIREAISAVKLGNTGYIYVVDREGKIIAHSQANIEAGTAVKEVPIVNEILQSKKRTGLERDSIFKSIWGQRVIASSETTPNTGWGIIAEWPFDDAQAVVGRMFAQIGLFSLATLILVILLSGFVALQLIKPIAALGKGAGVIGEGNLEYRIKIRTGDELEELGHRLNKMAENLKGLEELHTLRLKTEFLAESLKKEKELSTLKDQFVSVGSHQLYTPLSVINWTLEMLRQPNVPKDALQEGLTNIEQSRRDILAIANDLLTLSEIGFKYQKTKSEMLDIGVMLEEAIKKYREPSKEKKLKIELRKKTPDLKIDANKYALEKVIEAMLDNAIIYSDEGTTIEIEFSGDEKEVRFRIHNQGIGIPENEKQYIFQQFFRAKNAVAKKNVGTGLGLYIAKTIVEGHDGKIWFDSKENEDATFYFSIPRKTSEAGTATTQ